MPVDHEITDVLSGLSEFVDGVVVPLEAPHSRYGLGRILPYVAVGHWSYAPSTLCTHLTEAAAARMPSPPCGRWEL